MGGLEHLCSTTTEASAYRQTYVRRQILNKILNMQNDPKPPPPPKKPQED